MTNKPIDTVRSEKGGMSVTAWPGNIPGEETYTIRKTYKDKKTDEWKESKVYYQNDLNMLAKA